MVTKGPGVNWKQDLLKVTDAIGEGSRAKRLLASFEADAAEEVRKLGGGSTTVSWRSRPAHRKYLTAGAPCR